MTKPSYSELLRDPRWQKKRLEIMERDDFMCVHCCDDKSTLNVHHCFYKYGRNPWDYPNNALITVCEECHKEIGKEYNPYKKATFLVDSIVDKGVSIEYIAEFFDMLYGYSIGMDTDPLSYLDNVDKYIIQKGGK